MERVDSRLIGSSVVFKHILMPDLVNFIILHLGKFQMAFGEGFKTSQELRMLSSVKINCQVTKIVINSGSQLSQ